MKKWWLGIDPGKHGAMCLKCEEKIFIEDWMGIMPATAKLREWKPLIAGCFLELVHNMPKDGGSSAFRFGTNFGIWQGALAALEIPFKLISPQQWRKGLFDGVPGKNTKKKSLFVAKGMYPGNEYFKLEKYHDRAEAMLMAYQAERYFQNA